MARNPARKSAKKRKRYPRKGRPTAYCPQVVNAICKDVENCVPFKWACLKNSVSERTGHDWLNQYADFEQRIQRSKAKAVSKLVGNTVLAGKDPKNWPANFRMLESIAAEEFARPETQIAIAQVNGGAEKTSSTSIWTQQPSTPMPALDDLEFSTTWEQEPQQHIAQLPPPLPSPAPSAPGQPVEVQVEAEVERPYGWQNRKPDYFKPESELEKRLHDIALGKPQEQPVQPAQVLSIRHLPPPPPAGFGNLD